MDNKRKAEFGYETGSGSLVVPTDFGRDREDIYAVLHELGHANYKRESYTKIPMYVDYRDFLGELEAWQYAFRCVKPAYHKEFIFFAIDNLISYILNVKAGYGDDSIPSPEILIKLIVD